MASVWSELFESSNRFSFFMSWEWVDTWMSVFGELLQPSILLFLEGGAVMGACLLVESRVRRAALPLRRMLISASGEEDSEATYPEFNDLLCRPGAEIAVARTLNRHLRDGHWDELEFDGFAPGPGYDALRSLLTDLDWEEERRTDFVVDLQAIRDRHADYVSTLGKATRECVRRNRRHFAASGDLVLEQAAGVGEALSVLDEMALLSRMRGEALGWKSVFASERFIEFHRRLIRRCYPQRSVHLLRVSANGNTIGTSYLFEQRGRVYDYQCGFCYGHDPRWSPGTLTSVEVIQHCLNAGADEFIFLGGGAAYKQRLATGSRQTVWATARRRGWKMKLLNCLRGLKRFRLGARKSAT
jgi:hypothetical protein